MRDALDNEHIVRVCRKCLVSNCSGHCDVPATEMLRGRRHTAPELAVHGKIKPGVPCQTEETNPLFNVVHMHFDCLMDDNTGSVRDK